MNKKPSKSEQIQAEYRIRNGGPTGGTQIIKIKTKEKK